MPSIATETSYLGERLRQFTIPVKVQTLYCGEKLCHNDLHFGQIWGQGLQAY